MKREIKTIDVAGKSLGRAASEIAIVLRGKHRVGFTPHIDSGDGVLVVNFDKIKITGNNKMSQKRYYRHSGYLGNLKSVALEEMLEKNPERVLRLAVYGMLPKNKLRDNMIKRFKIKRS